MHPVQLLLQAIFLKEIFLLFKYKKLIHKFIKLPMHIPPLFHAVYLHALHVYVGSF